MRRTRRPVRSIRFRSATPMDVENRFPRAVRGEDFDRYARAMWQQSKSWMDRQWPRVAEAGLSMHAARDLLRSVAASELGRTLRVPEEQLLSVVLHETWTVRTDDMPDILPYWAKTAPPSPFPAA
jgi:hypothetical protein